LLILLGSIQVSKEPWVHCLITHSNTGREERFRNEVRHRDRKCVITGVSIPEAHIQAHNWDISDAAHIPPLWHESHWIQHNCEQWITDMDDATGSSKINSSQNGFLLRIEVHRMFDQHPISVNPDDSCKVVVLDTDPCGYDGRILDPVCRNPNDPHHVSNELPKRHSRLSVLANMRGAGELIFEHDFPPGNYTLDEIPVCPDSRERFGLEMAPRLEGVS